MIRALLLCIGLALSGAGRAQWQLEFDGPDLVDNAANAAILQRLRAILPFYKNNPYIGLRFAFHSDEHQQERWQALTKKLPALASLDRRRSSVEVFKQPRPEWLDISLMPLASGHCPTTLTIQDEALPLPVEGLRLTAPARLALSPNGTVSIAAAGAPLLLGLRDGQKLTPPLGQLFAPLAGAKRFRLGVQNPGKNRQQAEAQLLEQLQSPADDKGLSFGPVPATEAASVARDRCLFDFYPL